MHINLHIRHNLCYIWMETWPVLMGRTLGHSAPHVVSGAEAILGGLGAQVHHLVEAELAAID